MDGHIFISYSHKDEEFVLRLARHLEERNLSVWIDRGDIHAGAEWQHTIAQAVEDCLAFLLVISPDSVDSNYVAQELSLAKAHEIPIFPLLYRKTKIPEYLETDLFAFQFIDFGKGGYQDNFTDLLTGLEASDVSITDAPELSPEEQAERRLELLGAPEKVEWSTVFKRIPGWAIAWAIGWTIYWLILLVVLTATNSSGEGFTYNDLAFPIGGFFGGLIGGFWAGLVTMLVLRHHASSIKWKHMRSSIRIWGLLGPIGTIIAAGLAVSLVPDLLEELSSTNYDCSALSFGDCIGSMFANVIADSVVALFLIVILVLGYTLITIFALGIFSGWFAVRHIRRLEPGILGKQSIRVILGWGSGALVAFIGSFMAMSLLFPD
jgi:hypothetical protein